MSNVIKDTPVVFAVENDYKIFIPVNESSLVWVRVGDECYYDHSNGVLRSDTDIHKVTVPQSELDQAKKYTVCYRKMIERKPYFSETSDIEEVSFGFSPLPHGKFNLYQVADAHGMIDAPVASAKIFEEHFGKIDLLVLNGDVVDHSGDVKNFGAIYKIASLITSGNIPVVFSRGNHDTRGICAEKFSDYCPTRNGNSYFTFRLSGLWGIVFDCGEDKLDSHEEYGNTNCHEAFRREETRYLNEVVKNKASEYGAEGVENKIVLCHVPFNRKFKPPFNIEEDIYGYWTKVISDEFAPDVMLCGHTHRYAVDRPGSERDAYGQKFTTVIASQPNTKEHYFAGGGLVFDGSSVTAVFCDAEKIIDVERV